MGGWGEGGDECLCSRLGEACARGEGRSHERGSNSVHRHAGMQADGAA